MIVDWLGLLHRISLRSVAAHRGREHSTLRTIAPAHDAGPSPWIDLVCPDDNGARQIEQRCNIIVPSLKSLRESESTSRLRVDGIGGHMEAIHYRPPPVAKKSPRGMGGGEVEAFRCKLRRNLSWSRHLARHLCQTSGISWISTSMYPSFRNRSAIR